VGIISFDALLIDNGATCHITGAQDVYESFIKSELVMHVEIGMATKHAVKGF
jgi:hypothetical protein